MNRQRQVVVKEARSTVADDEVAIGEWATIGSVISVVFLKVPVAEADVRFGAQSGPKSDIARGPKSAKGGQTPYEPTLPGLRLLSTVRNV